jgi:simple sugar transport system ATP-binding protein
VADADQQIAEEMVVAPSSAPDDVLRVEHIGKRFGPTVALRDINLHLRKGEVLGLLGDNGAGKSTLIKIMTGYHHHDAGQMWLKGERFTPKSVDDARAHGIDTVFQDLALIDQLTVYHNLFLRRERVHRPIPFLSNALMRRHARRALDQIGINIPRIDVPVARLSGGQRQAIAVARTISGDADVILLDEPLAAMGAKEGAMILDLIQRLKEEGNVSIIMILHNYVHVLTACDRVNLIQDGVIALDKPTSETSVQELTEIVVEEYRRARMAAALGNGASAAGNGAATAGDGAGAADSNPAATGNRAADESATTESPAAPAPPAADDAGDAGDKPGS